MTIRHFCAWTLASLGLAAAAHAGTYTDATIKEYLAPLQAVHQTDAEKKGLEIYTRQYLMDEGWRDTEASMEMRLIDAAGRESYRKLVKRTLEDGNQPDKTLGIFLQPADVRGTIMLTFEKSHGADEQWLYLPALKRTKKINAENKSGSFLGTEFAWEDISTTELTKYRYRLLRDEGDQWVVERIPTDKFSGYSKEVTWVNKHNYQTVKIDYYDHKGDRLKTLTLDRWEQYQGRYWRPLQLQMVNHQNRKQTVLTLSSYKVGAGVEKRAFSSLGLDRTNLPGTGGGD